MSGTYRMRTVARNRYRLGHILRVGVLMIAAASCGAPAHLPVTAGTGPHPAIPPRREAFVPIVNYVKAKGWPSDAAPVAADGLAVQKFAGDLDHPRWLYVLPNGD